MSSAQAGALQCGHCERPVRDDEYVCDVCQLVLCYECWVTGPCYPGSGPDDFGV